MTTRRILTTELRARLRAPEGTAAKSQLGVSSLDLPGVGKTAPGVLSRKERARRQIRAIRWRAGKGLSDAKIAEQLGLSSNWVQTLRARHSIPPGHPENACNRAPADEPIIVTPSIDADAFWATHRYEDVSAEELEREDRRVAGAKRVRNVTAAIFGDPKPSRRGEAA